MTAPIRGAERVGERFQYARSCGWLGGRHPSKTPAADGTLPFESAAADADADWREDLANPSLMDDVNAGQLKQLYGAVSGRHPARGDPGRTRGGKRRFRRANRFYRAGAQRIEKTLEPLVKKKDAGRGVHRAGERGEDAAARKSAPS